MRPTSAAGSSGPGGADRKGLDDARPAVALRIVEIIVEKSAHDLHAQDHLGMQGGWFLPLEPPSLRSLSGRCFPSTKQPVRNHYHWALIATVP